MKFSSVRTPSAVISLRIGCLRKLVPEAEFVSRPRFSKLSYSGPKKLSRMKRRSAIVAFSASDVYALAEQIRQTSGGAAVVLGALSPRTRNAQVQMYQEGEVDYLVATDAIGMGLNMNIDHVAFLRLHKFDGLRRRPLAVDEIAQIAGRAGRYMQDGTFGTLAELGALDLILKPWKPWRTTDFKASAASGGATVILNSRI